MRTSLKKAVAILEITKFDFFFLSSSRRRQLLSAMQFHGEKKNDANNNVFFFLTTVSGKRFSVIIIETGASQKRAFVLTPNRLRQRRAFCPHFHILHQRAVRIAARLHDALAAGATRCEFVFSSGANASIFKTERFKNARM